MSADAFWGGSPLVFCFILVFLLSPVSSELEPLRAFGTQELMGWPGASYEADHYLPICGQLGTGDFYGRSFDDFQTCAASMEAFLQTEELTALYRLTGAQAEDTLAGDGSELCMCFALKQSVDNPMSMATCIYIDGDGNGDSGYPGGNFGDDLSFTWFFQGSYDFNTQKALNSCLGADLSELHDQFSATVAGLSTASSASSTSYSTMTTTNAHGKPTTVVVAESTSTSEPSSGGLTLDQKIALGVGIGIGLPSLFVAVIGTCMYAARS